MARVRIRQRMRLLWMVYFIWILLLDNVVLISPVNAASSTFFCKCMCFDKYKIIPLTKPEDAAKPCSSCTKQFCLDQKFKICRGAEKGEDDPDIGTGEDADVSTKCFQRDSGKDETIVYLYIFITLGLLVGAIIRPFAAHWYEQFIGNSRLGFRYHAMPT